MAIGERLYGEHKDFTGAVWRISIFQEGWASAAEQLTLVDPPFTIEWANTGDAIIEPIKASNARVSFYNMGDAEETLLEDLILAQEQQFYIQIKKGTDHYWCGPIVQDLITHQDTYREVITIDAVDGLGRLKDIPYPATSYNEQETLYDQLVDLLSINNTDQFWGATDTFISSNVNWYENQMYTTSPANTLEPLIKTRLFTDVFYKEEPAETSGDGQRPEPETITAYEALEQILRVFGARIHLELGRWWVMQPAEYNDSSCTVRSMYKDATVAGSSTFEHTAAINQTTLVRAGITYDYLPPFKQVNILHNVRSNKLLPRNKGFRTANHPDDDVSYTFPPLQGNNDSTFKIIYQVNNYMVSGFSTGIFLFDIEVELNFTCVEGSTTYYLRKNANTGKAEWSTTAGTYKVYITQQKGDNIVTGEIILPTPPWTYATTNTLTITFTPGHWTGLVWTPLSIPLNYGVWLNLVVLPNGQDESDIFYKATNDTYSNNSVVYEIPEVLIGDQSTRSHINRLEVMNTSNAWVRSSTWKIGNTGSGKRILSLLCETTMGMQKLPLERITGDIHLRGGTMGFVNTISINSVRYLPISLTYTPGNAEVVYSGEWVKIGLVTTGITVGDSLKNFQINADVIKVVGNLQRQLTAIGDTLQNFMYDTSVVAWLSDELSGSGITTIDVNALVAPLFKVGDVLRVISKEDVSIQEEVTVNAAPSAGDPTITIVSKNFTNTYPAGSYMLPKRHSIIADNITIDGILRLDNVPTSDPAVVGEVWSNGGILTLSAG